MTKIRWHVCGQVFPMLMAWSPGSGRFPNKCRRQDCVRVPNPGGSWKSSATYPTSCRVAMMLGMDANRGDSLFPHDSSSKVVRSCIHQENFPEFLKLLWKFGVNIKRRSQSHKSGKPNEVFQRIQRAKGFELKTFSPRIGTEQHDGWPSIFSCENRQLLGKVFFCLHFQDTWGFTNPTQFQGDILRIPSYKLGSKKPLIFVGSQITPLIGMK